MKTKQSRITAVPAGIRAGHLPTTSLERYVRACCFVKHRRPPPKHRTRVYASCYENARWREVKTFGRCAEIGKKQTLCDVH